jgi:prepilin-type N-terminal cleavage/methylation domain-containing protein
MRTCPMNLVASNRMIAPKSQSKPGFTLIELMVVIAVIGILISMVAITGPVVFDTYRQVQTKAVMRNAEIAIDQFAELDPLRGTYNSPSSRTFGRYPAYTLFNHEQAADAAAKSSPDPYIQNVVEPLPPAPDDWRRGNREFKLRARLASDLFGTISASKLDSSSDGLLSIDDDDDYDFADLQRSYDDMRALYAYLAVFVPDALEAVPPSSRAPLTENEEYAGSDAQGEFLNLSGERDNLDARIPIQGIIDAWGVPLDYHVMFKLQYTMGSDGLVGWKVTDRQPVLRSQGDRLRTLENAVQDAEKLGREESNARLRQLRDRWIFSRDLPGSPMPEDAFKNFGRGELFVPTKKSGGSPNQFDGWVRCRAGAADSDEIADSYSWLPITDSEN